MNQGFSQFSIHGSASSPQVFSWFPNNKCYIFTDPVIILKNHLITKQYMIAVYWVRPSSAGLVVVSLMIVMFSMSAIACRRMVFGY